ncbi:hypothetical protein NPIL_637691 [Nephila pilipes]|uniref:Uncharacterized protein n=1 Tax=Nephila pilipes TaxID=299642 RepID=A0A8X6PTC6_NEPPI|nr:hypothetical protein NPIL_637691 [Nephila pilipes]
MNLVSNVRQSSRGCHDRPNIFVLFDPKLTDVPTGYVLKPFAAFWDIKLDHLHGSKDHLLCQEIQVQKRALRCPQRNYHP